MSTARKVAFLYVGGVHHVAHTLPVAAALSMSDRAEVTLFCADATIEGEVRHQLQQFPGVRTVVRRLRRLDWLERLGRPSLTKLPALWRSRRLLRDFDALVSAECTSIALRRMGVRRPLFICLPHGAGDRAISFEPRFKRFNRVLVAGPKTKRRMVEAGVDAGRIRQVGYPKAEHLAEQARTRPRPFANDRPIVLYNPHFRTALSSLDHAPEIVRAIAQNTDVNMIVAPHIRAFESMSADDLERWQSLAVPGRVLVDTGSPQMIDMSHLAHADLYLGDVSSQVYEFLLLKLRPCLFVNAHGVEWDKDPDYAAWQLGEVTTVGNVVPAINAALRNPHRFAVEQASAVAETFGQLEGSAERAAAAIFQSFEESR